MKYLLFFIIAMSLWGFWLMKVDKEKAIRKEFRISEKKILTVAAFGGATGVGLGMLIYWHKVRKVRFLILIPALIGLHGFLLYKIHHKKKNRFRF